MIQILNTMWDNKPMIDEPYETTGIYQTFKTVFSQEIFTDESVSTGYVCTRSLPVIIIIFVSSLILMNRKLSIFTRDDFAIAHNVFPWKLRGMPRLVEILTIGKQNPLAQQPGVPTTPL